MKKKILIIDDDLDMCALLSSFLTRNNYEVEVSYSAVQGIAKFKQSNFDIVISDFRLGDKDGKDVLLEIRAHNPNAIVLIITGYSDIKIAVEVIKLGAYDYITKPLIPDEVLSVLKNAVNKFNANAEKQLNHPLKNSPLTDDKSFLTGHADSTRELYRQVEIVATTDYSVILYGESGTGKEVIAKKIHDLSHRKNKPFVAMDCGTLSKELAGSELFGHVKGAFTGAQSDKEGHFEMANEGTLFLDEVANLSYDIQASLLRVIQERKFKRVGGTKEISLDIRIIVASNENLQDAYRKGKFREDLYHRFNEFCIQLPPLRQRKEDIPLFANFFLKNTCAELNKDVKGFANDVIDMFVNYTWPGNLRECRNVIRRSVLLCNEEIITANLLPAEIILQYANKEYKHDNPVYTSGDNNTNGSEVLTPVKKDVYLKDTAAKAEYEAIMKVLKEVNFNKTKAAIILNVDRKTLYNKIKNYEN
ncbi:sigma-54 dependent transcriptional regulator [Ferruginibacter paludis]|uniref:sigma-54-dependent transcriptional regulator n=1 Tax=Ferruginibacter paludis TaxID=1310417 RepID=UPI0025B58AE4|nr:sigma-54 dependent transcriptional regulator [Ferruginibacter paludis]MDN3654429.1 sigma-54 dependent transcriptional regulator [Ferruginibacter paludis]